MDWLILVGGFVGLLLLRVPLAYCMCLSSLAYILHTGMPVTVLAQRLSAGLNSFPLLAVPFYIFAGQLMNTSGVSTRIFNFAASFVGHIRGGLCHVSIVANMIFAGISGTAVSEAAAMGAIEMKVMRDEGYDPAVSAAVIASSATIGPIIPPSVIFIIYGVMAEVSIGRLFAGGFIPGVLMGLSLMALVYFIAGKRTMPRRPRATLRQIWTSFLQAFLSLMMPIIILGGIGFGIVTPTESGALAVGYAILLGFVYKEINRSNIHSILKESVTVTCSVMFIIAAATLFSWLLVSQNIPQKATALILSITHNKWMVLLFLNIVLLIMGCFLDTMAILITVTPVFVPLVTALDIDLVHFGVVLGLNLMIGALTPPMGILFYIVSDVGKVPVEKVIKELWPFLFPLGIVLGMITYFPTIVTWLPTVIFK